MEGHWDAIITGLVTAAANVAMLKVEVKHLWAAIKRHEGVHKTLWVELRELRDRVLSK